MYCAVVIPGRLLRISRSSICRGLRSERSTVGDAVDRFLCPNADATGSVVGVDADGGWPVVPTGEVRASPEASADVEPSWISSGRIKDAEVMTIARSMQFLSSRMFPGQPW